MKLNIEQIQSICTGAARVEQTENGVRFMRFTKEQEELYRKTSKDFLMKSFATAGIRLSFETESPSLFLKANVTEGSSRKYFSFDVSVNGEIIDHLDNFSKEELPLNYTTVQLPLGTFSKKFSLGTGKKQVCIYMPWSMAAELLEFSLEEPADFVPVKWDKKMIIFGDSITQGYDALRPSNSYAEKLANMLHAEAINKGIGGECFFPELAMARDNLEPDYITVAYGTNDWSKTTEEVFKNNCQAFYEAISRNYPNAKIFAITPIWRKEHTDYKAFGLFHKVAEDIREIVKPYSNIHYIYGFDFVPKEEVYFADLRLHPNDNGFQYYAEKLYRQIQSV